MPGEDLLAYYAQRAHQYEQIYEKPERQPDLSRLRASLRDALTGHHILEIACGTGYWTAALAPIAAAITATDASPEVLALARGKQYPPGRVQFEVADAYSLDRVDGEFTLAWQLSGGRTCRASVSRHFLAASTGAWASGL